MVLVDTSIWISHLRDNRPALVELLNQVSVACHPFVTGELALGNLKNRREILTSLERLPTSEIATHQEVLEFIEARALMGKGLGLIDIHLLASAKLSSIPFWTQDQRLLKAVTDLGIDYSET
ncbi:MAG: type II toxin-antitoxin system VapC family toxin [Planctomycetes bacterium]|nr:type II toxin-antitoxin system VapC family toxin [Planctomycetota bacterium]